MSVDLTKSQNAPTLEADKEEYLLKPELKRFILLPIQHHDIWEMYMKAESSFWIPGEINLTQDIMDWTTKLNDNERHFISYVLAFFAGSDGLVTENLVTRFGAECQIAEARLFYMFQGMIEGIHSIVYGQLIETLVKDREERDTLFRAIEKIPVITKKAEWAYKYIESQDASFAKRLIGFACIEGIFFSGSFAAIFWLKKRGLMPGLGFSNALISRDEALHVEFACLLYRNYVKNKLSESEVHEIVDDAVKLEIEFLTEALPVRLLGINADLMGQYIKYVADHLLNSLGIGKLYNATNPFDFMENISIDAKENMFECKISQYAKANAMQTDNSQNFVFNTEADF